MRNKGPYKKKLLIIRNVFFFFLDATAQTSSNGVTGDEISQNVFADSQSRLASSITITFIEFIAREVQKSIYPLFYLESFNGSVKRAWYN